MSVLGPSTGMGYIGRTKSLKKNFRCSQCHRKATRPVHRAVTGICVECEKLNAEKEAEEIVARRNQNGS